MKKNKYIMLVLFLLVLVLAIAFVSNKDNTDDLYNENIPQVVKEEDMLSMMLETSYESGEYKQVTQSSWPSSGYAFNATLSKCENGSELSWDDEQKLVYFAGSSIDKCYVYFDKVLSLADYVTTQYTGIQGENNIYYHDSSLTNGAGDSSYRYAGASTSVNNYLCIDPTSSTAATCPDADLFRIIGVFNNQVKVIKATSIGYMEWDSNGSNTWSTSSLKTYLNETYTQSLQASIGDTMFNKIVNATWKVGGNSYGNIMYRVPSVVYQNEVVSPLSTNSTDNATEYGPNNESKIGLMYASDYGFAADPAAWTTTLINYSGSVNGSTIKSLDWLYLGSTEWLITRDSKDSIFVYNVSSNGNIDGPYNVILVNRVRPTFYLNSDVTYASGDGSQESPIRLGA